MNARYYRQCIPFRPGAGRVAIICRLHRRGRTQGARQPMLAGARSRTSAHVWESFLSASRLVRQEARAKVRCPALVRLPLAGNSGRLETAKASIRINSRILPKITSGAVQSATRKRNVSRPLGRRFRAPADEVSTFTTYGIRIPFVSLRASRESAALFDK
jgi:hypothetical protein